MLVILKGIDLVLALKYRPEKFDNLVGQSQVVNTLKEALNKNRLSHAYLFSGLRGSGKTSTARIFSKALICSNGPTYSPCEICENCLMIQQKRHPDIIEMDGASNRKIDDIRELIEHSKYHPSIAKFKIFIIDEVHMLTKEAFNALLKTLEEPPSFVKFILATTDPLKLPATILSRTQNFKFTKISKESILNHLIYILENEKLENETLDYEKEALEIIARSGSGSLRDTLTLLDQAIIYSKGFVDVKTVTDMLGLVDPKFIETIFEYIYQKDYKAIRETILELENFEAEMVIDELIIFIRESTLKDNIKFETILIDRFFRILADAKILLSMNADSSFVLTLTFFKMIESLKVKDIDSFIDEIESKLTLSHQNIKPKESKKIEIESKSDNKFDILLERIEKFNQNLAHIFKKNIEFISFENNTLTWSSRAIGDEKKLLSDRYANIQMFVKEIYGIDTNIKLQKIESKQPERQESVVQTQNTKIEDITNSPFVKKAQELFKVKKIDINNIVD